jgi:hypothetical protein
VAVLTAERSMRWCRKHGLRVDKVEQWVGRGRRGVRRDLWGWADLLAFDGEHWIGIQSCTMNNRAAHLKAFRREPKILAALRDWLHTPTHRAELWAWVQRKSGGGRWAHEVTDLARLL